MEGIKIQNLSMDKGCKVSGYIKVINTELLLLITLISGNREGKTVLITGGIHNLEYVGIQAVIELANKIKFEDICGNVIIMPLINKT